MIAEPGQVVEFEDGLYLVEEVRVQMVMQRIEPLMPRIHQYPDGFTHNPVFMSLEGDINDPRFRTPKMRNLSE